MHTLRMSSGIRACCRLVMRAARPRSRRHNGRFRRLSTILPGSFCIFREMPGVTPVASIGTWSLWRIGGYDLVCGCGQRLTFARVLPLPTDRTF
jgi:hypothetical protein